MTYTRTIDNSQDIMDSRDVIARIEELQTDITYGWNDDPEADTPEFSDIFPWPASAEQIETFGALCDEKDVGGEFEELLPLLEFADEASGCADWVHGETLIRETYFRDYCQQFAEDIGAIEHTDRWPNYCIDWDRAAAELRMDYFGADYDGVTYYVRS